MKYKNFKYIGMANGVHFAEIDVVSGFFFKKIETKKIFKKHLNWQFLDGGFYTKGFDVERMEDAWRAAAAIGEKL